MRGRGGEVALPPAMCAAGRRSRRNVAFFNGLLSVGAPQNSVAVPASDAQPLSLSPTILVRHERRRPRAKLPIREKADR